MTSTQPVRYIEAITRRYQSLGFDPYRWFQAETPPALTRLEKPLGESRLGVLSTSGAYVAGQVAYHYKDDTSLRAIPKGTPTENLRFAHLTENYLESSRRDPNSTLPVDVLRAIEADGEVGEVADDLISCMGAVYSQRRVREELIPAVEERFRRQQVDAALLIPM